MTKLITTLCLSFAVLLVSIEVSQGTQFQRGLDAARSGDYQAALSQWKPLAEHGNESAQFNLGVIYHKGLGIQYNYRAAVKWYTLAAEQGNAPAQYNLGVMYRLGQGVLQNYKTAVKWYTLAAKQGSAKSQFNLGVMYAKGKGVLQDNVNAHMWLNISSSSGKIKNAAKNRDIVAELMTPDEISTAEKLARACIANSYKGC